jgi:hypothetical protein
MEHLAKLDFLPLSISGENYIKWTMNVKLYLTRKHLRSAIEPDSDLDVAAKAEAMILIVRHIDNVLQLDYADIEDPLQLWNELKDRFDHQKTILLPEARMKWLNLRFSDFKTVTEYNSEICRIKSTHAFCGHPLTDAELIEKTYQTFPASHAILMQ